MSRPAPPAPPPPAPPPPAARVQWVHAQGPVPPGLLQRLTQSLVGGSTPARLRLAGLVASIGLVLFGVLGVLDGNRRTSCATDLARATTIASQAQQIRAELSRADATAAVLFLAGGTEDPDRRADYEDAVAKAGQAVVAVSAVATGQARIDIETVQQGLQDYRALVETARANNRQGFPVGAAYLRQASSGLREGTQAAAQNLVTVGDTELRSAARCAAGGGLVGIAPLIALAGLALPALLLFRRTRRWLNPGVVASALAVAVATLFTLGSVRGAASNISDAIDSSWRSALLTSEARSSAQAAKADEALALIARGNSGPFDERFEANSNRAFAYLDAAGVSPGDEARDPYERWLATHDRLVGSPFEERRQSVIEVDGASAAFSRGDTALNDLSLQRTSEFEEASAQRSSLRLPAITYPLAAAVALAALWWGLGRRLAEYR
jgi:hypothetical protein